MSRTQSDLAVLIIGMAIFAVVFIGPLLIQLGCHLTGAEVPSFGRALVVLLITMVVGFFMNLTIAGMVSLAAGGNLSNVQVAAALKWMVLAVQLVVDILLFAAIAACALNKVSFLRGLVIGFVLFVGMFGLGFLSSMAFAAFLALHR
ncbi:hypothetical protein AYO40_06675 [Planctomycetaceae bacterium SCGC AG-212-D15]|nr:hypothetical protein AYO40_06675 [Planctomycetaceae bacterium SCGC AG-212-D15]